MPEVKLTSSQAFPRVVPPSIANTLYGNVMKKSNIRRRVKRAKKRPCFQTFGGYCTLGVKNSSKLCFYSVRETHTLFICQRTIHKQSLAKKTRNFLPTHPITCLRLDIREQNNRFTCSRIN